MEGNGMKSRGTYQFTGPSNLFWRRLKEYARNQMTVYRSISDWSVWLYVLIPGVLLSARLYYDLWVVGLPSWSEALPGSIFPSLMVLLMYRASILLFVQEGDVLFIRRAHRFMSGIMLRGAIYSMTMMIITSTVVFVILLPFLVQRLDLNAVEALSYLIFSITASWIVAWSRHMISVNYVGWRRQLFLIPTIGVLCSLYAQVTFIWMDEPQKLLLISFLLLCIVFLFISVRLKMQGTFMNDVQEDNKLRVRLTGLMLSQAIDKPRATRTKTWIFRNSPYLYRSRSAERRMAGAAVKSSFRNPQDLKLYVQFTGVCVLAMIWPPFIIKCILLLATYILFTYWHYLCWVRFVNDEWIALLPWSLDLTAQARTIAIRTLLLPFTVIISLTFSLSLLGMGWGWLLVIPLVFTLYGLTSYILALLTLSRSRS